jgi:hypothetical protein
MIQDILIGLTTVLFIVLVLLIGYLIFDDNDWGKR